MNASSPSEQLTKESPMTKLISVPILTSVIGLLII